MQIYRMPLPATMSLCCQRQCRFILLFQKPAWVLAIDVDVQYRTANYRRYRRCVYIVVQVQWQNILQCANAMAAILCERSASGSTP